MHISKEELLKFKNNFLTEKGIILENKKFIQKNLAFEREELSDEIDLITIEQQKNFDLRMQKRTDLFLKKIESALLRIQNGSFGVCEGCEDPIDIKRLQARPTCTLCIQCKEAQEKKEEIFGSTGIKKHLRVI
jgi:DnaK suppressor protein